MVSQPHIFSCITKRAIEVIFFVTAPMFFACQGSDQKSDSSTGGAATTGGAQSAGGNGLSGGAFVGQGGAAHEGGSASGGGSGAASGSGSTSGGTSSSAGGVSGAASGGASGASGAPTQGTCSPPPNKDLPYARLSETGCVDSAHPTQFDSKVIPYEVNSPLWSDSADKARGMVLPAGGKINVLDCTAAPSTCTQGPADSGRWTFPVGTVMIKNFGFDGKLVETRLFERFDENTWVGYSYAWDAAQTDATIVPDTRTAVTFNTGTRSVDWSYPSRSDCTKCHLKEAGSVLGPETAQMNRMLNGTNQIDHLQSLGLFQTPPSKPYSAALVTPYTGQLGSPPASATLEQKARSYLHSNCAFCHRPDGSGVSIDVRNDVAFKDTMMCNAVPAKGDQGVADAVILAPGNTDMSVLFLRMQTEKENSGRMPPIASAHADVDGVKLIGDWIKSIQSCP